MTLSQEVIGERITIEKKEIIELLHIRPVETNTSTHRYIYLGQMSNFVGA